MTKRHYYAMHTPGGDLPFGSGTPLGTVIIFDRKISRDEWVEDNTYNMLTGAGKQTRSITEHEARVTMLRQHGHAMAAYRKRHGLYDTYREYAQFCPTWLMVKDYDAVADQDSINQRQKTTRRNLTNRMKQL